MNMTDGATSYNRAYLASCPRHSAQIPRYTRNFRYAQPLAEIRQYFRRILWMISLSPSVHLF